MLEKLNEQLDCLGQEPSRSPRRALETSDTSRDGLDNSWSRRKVLSKKIYPMKKSYGADELGNLFVFGLTNANNVPT